MRAGGGQSVEVVGVEREKEGKKKAGFSSLPPPLFPPIAGFLPFERRITLSSLFFRTFSSSDRSRERLQHVRSDRD